MMRNNDVARKRSGRWLPAWLLVVGLLGVNAAAGAAEFQNGFYLGAAVGQLREDSDIVGSAGTNTQVSQFMAGYYLWDWFSAEVGYADFGNIKYNRGGASDKVENDSFFARASLQIPISRREKMMTAITLTGGAHRWDVSKKTYDSADAEISHVRSRGTSVLAGAGILVRSRDTALRLDYQVFTDAGKDDKIDLQALSANLLFYF